MIEEVIHHYKINPVLVPDAFMVKFFMTAIVTVPKIFESDLTETMEWGFRNFQSPSEFFRFLDKKLFPDRVQNEYRIDRPSLEIPKHPIKQKPTPKPLRVIPEITPTPMKKFESRRGETWRSHRSEKKLWRSSKAVFDHLLYRGQIPKDPEKFPWCQVGIKSLMKYTGYSDPQITRALAQLQRFKRIKRIVIGNEFQGASKYLVFFTLEMSRAHSYKSRHRKKDQPIKERSHGVR